MPLFLVFQFFTLILFVFARVYDAKGSLFASELLSRVEKQTTSEFSVVTVPAVTCIRPIRACFDDEVGLENSDKNTMILEENHGQKTIVSKNPEFPQPCYRLLKNL